MDDESTIEAEIRENNRRLAAIQEARETITDALQGLDPKDRVALARWIWDGLRPRRKQAAE